MEKMSVCVVCVLKVHEANEVLYLNRIRLGVVADYEWYHL